MRQLQLGPMKNFVYLIGAAESSEVAVVDPAWDAPAIASAAVSDDKRISALLLSHHHHDHINAVPALLKQFDVPVFAQAVEVEQSHALRGFSGALRAVKPGETVRVGALEVVCAHTPGHTPGSQCLWCRGALFSGDTVFVNACGRCDLPGGDPAQMYDSLRRVLGALSPETRLWPGHDYGHVPVSSLGRERLQNPYFQLDVLEDFVAYRMRKPR